ncbi:NCA2-domain-containing protein [Aspergillus ellipticus CBS 707.79]|uniref:NCA2-domain-containing protein n=1 Tax=Aspergillus ellipticus CBS 707.79 TaxID=1448320 RepID=A0A319DM20_9EURO|nr:NCA2-domain-containing protein [Aspergillus ellipticus CBS 707.79]
MYVTNNKLYHLHTQLDKLEKQIKDNPHLKLLDLHMNASQATCPTDSIAILKKINALLSTTSRSKPVLRAEQVAKLISEYPDDFLDVDQTSPDINVSITHMIDYSWMVAAKAAVQTFGIILESISEDMLVIDDEIVYWDRVLESNWFLGLYALQTSPAFLWNRLGKYFSDWYNAEPDDKPQTPVSERWAKFYRSVHQCVLSHSVCSLRTRLLSPLSLARSEVQRNRKSLGVAKNMNASGIGLLMRKVFLFETDDHDSGRNGFDTSNKDWQNVILHSVAFMRSILENEMDDKVAYDPQNDTLTPVERQASSMLVHYCSIPSSQQPKLVIQQIRYILKELHPSYATASRTLICDFGRPNPFVRYWLPLSIALFSTSTLLELLTNRRRELLGWIADISSTTIEFWNNWVVDPMWKLLRTIRHNEESEIALMSRNSLEADRASLERMVVDFVLDRCEPRSDDFQVVNTRTITAKVREGDLTPVLKAYEKDLRSPFVGTVRGDLVRALLIQIQKTKVDVEVAIGGIDALLKSQELVFGFVGLTPGIMVSYATFCWLYGLLGNRKGLKMGRQQDKLRHALRNVHRTLILPSSVTGVLTYKDFGLLVYNAEILLSKARLVLRGTDLHMFEEDICDLIEQNRIDQQLRIIERMSWMYSKWI